MSIFVPVLTNKYTERFLYVYIMKVIRVRLHQLFRVLGCICKLFIFSLRRKILVFQIMSELNKSKASIRVLKCDTTGNPHCSHGKQQFC